MPTALVNSRWSSGSLIFYEEGNKGTIADLLTIAPATITIGSETQDVDFKIFVGAVGQHVVFDAGAATVTFTGVTTTLAAVVMTGLDLSGAAADITAIANTAAALEFYDSTTKFFVFDTRNTVTAVANVTATGIPATITAASGVTHNLVSLAPGTTTLTGATGVTAMNGLALTVAQPTITSASNPAVGIASTVYIAAEPAAGGTATITNPYALSIASGNMLTAGKIICDETTDSSSGTTGSIQTDGGIGAAKKIVSSTGFILSAGDLNMATAAGDIVVPANTAAALEFYDATTKFLVVDSRNTVTGVANITVTGMPATITAASGVTHQLLALAPGTTTLSGATGVTAMNGLGLSVAQPTITSASAPATGIASTVYIAAEPAAGGTATITNPYALYVDSGDVRFDGTTASTYLHWDDSADDLLLVGAATQFSVAGTTNSTSVSTGSINTAGGLGVAADLFLGGDLSIATAKKITTVAELTLNSVDPLTIQIGGVDFLQMDEAAIATFAGATDTAGHAAYIETEDGGADGGAGTGRAGGLLSVKTGDGSASATAGQVGGAGGALSLITGAGLTGNTTGNGGVGGAFAITAGAGGNSGAGAGVGGTGGSITLTAGAGGGAGGGTAGAPGSIDIGAGVVKFKVQTIAMGDAAVTTTLVPGTPAGTLITGNILYVDAESSANENLLLPPEGDCTGLFLIIENTGGETINVQDDAGGGVVTLETANVAYCTCDGTSWDGTVGVQ